jgi:hypothetical protein
MIAKKKKVSRNFVAKWTKTPIQGFTKVSRGCLKGRRRRWREEDEQRIKSIHYDLCQNPSELYTGATAIEQEWRIRHPDISPPPLRTIGQILSDLCQITEEMIHTKDHLAIFAIQNTLSTIF